MLGGGIARREGDRGNHFISGFGVPCDVQVGVVHIPRAIARGAMAVNSIHGPAMALNQFGGGGELFF